MKIIPLDEKRMVAKFAPGIEIPLHPFFRQHGRRAAGERGPLQQRAAVDYGGHLDTRDLVAGTTLYSFRCTRPALSLKWATATPGQGDAKWTSPRWKLRSSARFNLWCARTCT